MNKMGGRKVIISHKLWLSQVWETSSEHRSRVNVVRRKNYFLTQGRRGLKSKASSGRLERNCHPSRVRDEGPTCKPPSSPEVAQCRDHLLHRPAGRRQIT